MTRTDPKIVLAFWDNLGFFDEAALDRIAQLGTLLDRVPLERWDDARADELLSQAEVIIGHWGCPPLTAPMLDRAPDLGLFAYTAGTVKMTIDEAVLDRGIRVTSGSDANAIPTAEFAFASILLANKGMFWRRRTVTDQTDIWQPVGDRAWGNLDKTVGIVGASLVGRHVLRLLRPFTDLAVTLYDPYVTAEEAADLGARKVELDELCATADVLSIHAPALAETHHLIGPDQLALLRDGAVVINTARAWLVDDDALVDELRSGRLYAVLDVSEPEPLPDDSPLLDLRNVFVTPHIAGAQGTELQRLTDHLIDEIERWKQDRPAANEVTKQRLDRMA